MEKKVLAAMKKAANPVRPGEVAKMIGAESKDVSKDWDWDLYEEIQDLK